MNAVAKKVLFNMRALKLLQNLYIFRLKVLIGGEKRISFW